MGALAKRLAVNDLTSESIVFTIVENNVPNYIFIKFRIRFYQLLLFHY